MFEDNFSYSTSRLKIRFYQPEDFENWKILLTEMKPKQNQWDWEVEDIEDLTKERFVSKLNKHKEERQLGKCLYFCRGD